MKLEKTAFCAAALRAEERAPAAVAMPHAPTHLGGNATGARLRDLRPAWARRFGELGTFQLPDEQCQRTIDNDTQIAVRHGMAQQILRSAQLPVCLGRKCELQLVAFRRKWSDYRPVTRSTSRAAVESTFVSAFTVDVRRF
jgi:hypothetical protein